MTTNKPITGLSPAAAVRMLRREAARAEETPLSMTAITSELLWELANLIERTDGYVKELRAVLGEG